MSDIPSFPYSLLWEERQVCSVANLTRQDAREFMELAPRVPVRTDIMRFKLEEANVALGHLRAGRIHGAAVLCMEGDGLLSAWKDEEAVRGIRSATAR